MGTTTLAPTRRGLPGSKRLLVLRDDDHLVTHVRAGEQAAFEVLYERHVPGVLSFCRHMLGSHEEAEDAIQIAFASAHRDLVAGDRAVNFKPWIYTIARNRCLSMLRARRQDLPEDLGQATEGLDAQVQARADLRELVADLQDLPEDQRAALLLSEIRDLSYAEVADVLECEPSQVKGLVHRARSGLLERREARSASCEEIRVELASARGGGLKRGRLRHHLKSCSACSAYWEDVRQQRTMLALVLPVIPSLGLKAEVLAAVGFGGGAAGGGLAAGGAAVTGAGAAGLGSAASGGGIFAAATVAKVAAVVALAGGAGAAGIVATDGSPSPRSESPVKRDNGPPGTEKGSGGNALGQSEDPGAGPGIESGQGRRPDTGAPGRGRKSGNRKGGPSSARSKSGGLPPGQVKTKDVARGKRDDQPKSGEPKPGNPQGPSGGGGRGGQPPQARTPEPAPRPNGDSPKPAKPDRPTGPPGTARGKPSLK